MDFDWLWEAVREAGVDRIVFGATAPVQRWCMGKAILPVMRWVRHCCTAAITNFRTLASWRKAAIVGWIAYGVSGLLAGFIMGDDAPLAVQAWTVSVGAMMVAGYGWWGISWVRRMGSRLLMGVVLPL